MSTGISVYKFGGASVKDAESVRNAAKIVRRYNEGKLVLVVSAMGKNTNALEKVAESFYHQKEDLKERVNSIRSFYTKIAQALFPDGHEQLEQDFKKIFGYLEQLFSHGPNKDFDLVYDQVVPVGELLSTKVISAYFRSAGIENEWIDARKLVLTDSTFRNANVDWGLTSTAIGALHWKEDIQVTQGFIGGTKGNFMTTLGREGSDYTGAIFANVLEARSLTVWKDVEGILNADPKFFNNTSKLNKISYKEAIELAYYGASVIHPKTIKPLQNKHIPLYVRSFVDPAAKGTLISEDYSGDGEVASYIFKKDQVLISISPKDFSFIGEKNISEIFAELAACGLEANTMQNSAINFSICCDNRKDRIDRLIKKLQPRFTVRYNEGLQLLTIRHYNDAIIKKLVQGKKVLLEQKSRNTVKVLFQ